MGAVVSAQIFHHLSARSLERGIPQREVSAGLSPGKKARGRVLQRNKATRNPSSPPFLSHMGVSSTFTPTLVCQSRRGTAGGKGSSYCTSTRGHSPPAGGWEALKRNRGYK